uniref:Uncharacterized protein n=1 Tax=Crocodylus porosus TaxID=8502 RepID=A0A7M4F956_CROPO
MLTFSPSTTSNSTVSPSPTLRRYFLGLFFFMCLFHILLVRQDNSPAFPHSLAEGIIKKCLLCFLKASYVNLSFLKADKLSAPSQNLSDLIPSLLCLMFTVSHFFPAHQVLYKSVAK